MWSRILHFVANSTVFNITFGVTHQLVISTGMTDFSREFPLNYLTNDVLTENSWFTDLLRRWQPAGNEIKICLGDTGDVPVQNCAKKKSEMGHLRAAFRGGYMNFYCGGQSISNVRFSRSGLRAMIHEKYVYGSERTGKKYAKLTSEGIREPYTGQLVPYSDQHLEQWIWNAKDKIGTEKRFVDLVVAHNPNVIDVEMGLPAFSTVREERVAPRIDIVALEPYDGRWRVVLWEEKLVGDGRLRCRGSALPKVVGQLKHYSDWLSDPERAKRVTSAYRNNCRLLVGLHAITGCALPELGPGIRAVAASDAPPLIVDPNPRLLIIYDKTDRSFEENGHADKLRGAGVPLRIVKKLNDLALCGLR